MSILTASTIPTTTAAVIHPSMVDTVIDNSGTMERIAAVADSTAETVERTIA